MNEINETKEFLVCLMEEAGEVIQICSKILRHGEYSYHPEDKQQTCNYHLLEKELGDLECVVDRLCQNGFLDLQEIITQREYKHKRMGKYLHGDLNFGKDRI